MRLDEYTPDNICRAMGLSSFAEDEALHRHGEAFRVVFMPSFHPEVVVTIWKSEMGISVQVAALLRQFWQETFPARLPAVGATATLSSPDFGGLQENFHEANRSLDSGRYSVTIIDGMRVEFCYYAQGSTEFLKRSEAHSEATTLLRRRIIEAAWASSTAPRLANAVAAVAHYENTANRP